VPLEWFAPAAAQRINRFGAGRKFTGPDSPLVCGSQGMASALWLYKIPQFP